ncbi:MAG TPA: hypothetical protein VFE53_08565 [Mucilaginibacter sp.]|jgi:hypothetical protein|nr:hypothetical protein [Mucilaginibacter sp.]
MLENLKATLDPNEHPTSSEIELFPDSRQGTAKKAISLLIKRDEGYKEPNKVERINLLIAYAKLNKVVYGKAFDVVKLPVNEKIDLENLSEVEKNIGKIAICEIKSTTKESIGKNFDRYFFGLTTAELLVAQNLKSHFKFIFVNIKTQEVMELTLKEIFEKAKGIYPVWSIQF